MLKARNTASRSENLIHDDRVAAEYGFRGGLAPGVTIYGYMASAVVEQLSPAWLERGSMQVRFHAPFYEGDEVVVRSDISDAHALQITAEQQDGTVCATGSARLDAGRPVWNDGLMEHPLPASIARPQACRDTLLPGTLLGTLRQKVDLTSRDFLEDLTFDTVAETRSIYYGVDGIAHPAVLLGLANRIFIRNFQLGPWIHTGSQLTNFGTARHGDELIVRGSIHERFERKGHEFAVLDLSVSTSDCRRIQSVRHTAIYKPAAR